MLCEVCLSVYGYGPAALEVVKGPTFTCWRVYRPVSANYEVLKSEGLQQIIGGNADVDIYFLNIGTIISVIRV